MLTANELDIEVMKLVEHYDPNTFMDELGLIGLGQVMEIFNESPAGDNLYYQWLACLMKFLKPKQVVELGAAAGISTLLMAREMPKDSKLYSVDNDPAAWRWMNREYPQVEKILGDDLDMKIWKGVDLDKTDVWFIDTIHTEEQLHKELELYHKFFKKGAVVVFDDIRINYGMERVWDALPWDKCETTHPLHHTGFGHVII